MNQKRLIGFVFLSLILLNFVVGVVSAQIPEPISISGSDSIGEKITKFIDGVQDVGSPIFKPLLGETDDGSELFVRILAFFLVTLLIYGLLDSVRLVKSKWINFALGVIVSLIGIRFMPPGLLASLTEPASALVAFVFMGLPFIIAFYMIEKVEGPARRALWVAYGVLILVLFFYKWGDKGFQESFAWVDLLILLGIFMAFWFDGTFQRFMSKGKANSLIGNLDADEIDRISSMLENKKNQLARGGVTQERKAVLRDEIRELERELRAFASAAASRGVRAI